MLRIILAVAILAASFPVLAGPGSSTRPKPRISAEGHQIIRAMTTASTWGHPDLYGQFAGMANYAHGDYKDALKHFKYGARYADKLSQLCIGLMYLNGRGVKRDPATAWAWLALAAERDYPQFVATRDRVRGQLDPAQRVHAERIRTKLAATYSDKVAKPRMRHELQYWRTQITGSHTGFNSGVKHVDKRALEMAMAGGGGSGASNPACSSKTIEGVPMSGCGGNFYAKWRWDPDTYFAVKDARWKASVNVGALKQVKGPDQHPPDDQGDHRAPRVGR